MRHQPFLLGELCLAAFLAGSSSRAQDASSQVPAPVFRGARALPADIETVTGDVVGSLCQDVRLRAPTHVDTLREMSVRIDWAALERLQPGAGTQRIDLPVFGQTLELSFYQRDLRDAERYTWFGVIAGLPMSDVILVREHDAIQVTAEDTLGGRTWILSQDGPELHALREKDKSLTSGDWCGTGHVASPAETPRVSAPDGSSSGSERLLVAMDPPDVIDVLFVCTNEALTWFGSTNAWRAGAESMVARFNATTANSSTGASPIDVTLRISGFHPGGGYSEDGDGGVDLGRLYNDSDGFLDFVQPLRDESRADLVALVRLNHWGCSGSSCTVGVAYRPDTLASLANGVFSVTCLTDDPPRTFTHEIGHNFGACHDVAQGGCATSITPSPHGIYVSCNQVFGSICSYTTMAYSPTCAFGNNALPLWSNVGLNYDVSGDGCGAFGFWDSVSNVGGLIQLGRSTLAQNRIGSTLKWTFPGVPSSGANGTLANPFPTVTQSVALIHGGPAEGVVQVKAGTYADTAALGGPVTLSQGCRIVPDGGPIVIH